LGTIYQWDHPSYGLTYQFPSGQGITGWHDYTLEWSASSLRCSVDGAAPYVTVVSRDPFNQDFCFILNLAVGGMFDNDVQPPRPMAQQRMLVDYVRVYQRCK
jgi:beta-glucanase (GH16 family)